MTGGLREPRRTIQLELSARDDAWAPARRPPAPPPRERPRSPWRSRRLLAALLAAGTGGLVAGAVLVEWAWPEPAPAAGWRPVAPGDGTALRDMVPAGLEGGLPLYACRGPLAGGTQLGRYRADFRACHVGHGGRELEVAPFEVFGATWAGGAERGGRAPLVAGEVVDAGPGRPFAASPVFVCRAGHRGGVHPGALRADERGCAFGYGGRAVTSREYSVLQSGPWMTWSDAAADALPQGALVGGEEGGEPFLVCRASTRRGLLPGKVKRGSAGCSVASEGRELVEPRFQVLTPRWQAGGADGAVALGALTSGWGEGGLQYPCRGRRDGTVQPGRVDGGSAGCRVGMQGGEAVLRDYEVLAQ